MSATTWVSTWATWEKSSNEQGGGTAKTDKTSMAGQKTSNTGVGGTDKTDKPPPQRFPACAVCGGDARWNDHGVQRCRTCWPTPLTRRALEAEQTAQAQRPVRTAVSRGC